MLVAHQDDRITHAVIGGKKSINFGISDDPAFFQILSSALYKDPMLAMVRETICNAWDAHIENECTDRPIQITLDDDYLIIKDFGKGIPDNLIGPIYAIYGASTKKNDGRQTGGFGLGCKSPFAYTDHFEVTSCHGGMKTIYNMSKSSAEVQGKPTIIPIASFPSNETGIQVKIPLDPMKNNFRIEELIKQVVFNGDIKATLNGNTLNVLGLDKSQCDLVLINNHAEDTKDTRHLTGNGIYIRYGNVIYPIECAEEFSSLYQKVYTLLIRHYHCSLVMLAPPDSISITPSRESLTLSDITVATVTDLLSKFLTVFFKNQEVLVRHKELVNEYVDAASKLDAPLHQKLPWDSWVIPGIPSFAEKKVLTSTEDFALLEVLLRYSTNSRIRVNRKHWFNHFSRYLFNLENSNLFDRGVLHTWHRTFKKNIKKMQDPEITRYGSQTGYDIATMWWRKQILSPLVQKMMEVLPDFNRKRLFYKGFHVAQESWSSNKDGTVYSVGKVVLNNHTCNLVHLLKPTIVVSFNSSHVPKRMRHVPIANWEGTITKGTYFAYEISRKKGEAERVLEALDTIAGIEVVDLTKRLPYEQQAYEERQAQIQKARADAAAGKVVHPSLVKKVKPGLVRFNYILDKTHNRINTKILSSSVDPDRITDPEFVVLISTGEEWRNRTRNHTPELAYAAAMLYGDKGAVTNKRDTYARYKKEKGAVDIDDYLLDKILHDMTNSPSLVSYHASSPDKMNAYIDEKASWDVARTCESVLRLLIRHPELNFLIPKFTPLSEEDKLRWVIWSNLNQLQQYGRVGEVNTVRAEVEKIPLEPEIAKFLDKLIFNEFLGLIDADTANQLLIKHRKDPNKTNKIVSILTPILS